MQHWFNASLAAFLLWSSALTAQTVSLTLKDGSFTVTGELLSFDGEFYDIDSSIGKMTLSAATVICAGDNCPNPDDYVATVRIAGSAALGEVLIPELIESFAGQQGLSVQSQENEDRSLNIDLLRSDGQRIVSFDVALSSTELGYMALLNDGADIVVARRSPTPSERVEFLEGHTGGSTDPIQRRVIGWENLRLYTNDTNPTDALTVSELIRILDADTGTWPGDDALPVHFRGDMDSAWAMRQQLGLSGAPAAMGTGADTDPGVLYITQNLELPLQPIALSPTCRGIQDGVTFAEDVQPLSAPIYLMTTSVRHPAIFRDFMDFTTTLPAQRVVAQAGFISRTPTEEPLAGERGPLVNAILNATADTDLADLQAAVRALHGFGRLSLTFRFTGGTMELNDVSRSNLDFAASLLRQSRYRDRDVLFVGFSDGVGAADGNRAISRDRARVVRDAIRTRMGETAPPLSQYRIQGFGESLPLACNDTSWGQNQNRRVEIWLR